MLRIGIKKLRAYGDFTRIRKVFRKQRSYACGMCRTEYKFHAEAQGCLNECILDMLKEYPVVHKNPRNSHSYFMCKLCARRYNTRKEAEICGEDCKIRIFGIANKYAEVSPAETPSNRPKRKKKVMVVAQPVTRIKKEAEPLEEPVIEPPEEATETPTIEADIAPEPSVEPEPEEVQEAPKPKRDQKKKWHRADAKYVCETCAEEYFTKIEAEQCWQSHSPDFDE